MTRHLWELLSQCSHVPDHKFSSWKIPKIHLLIHSRLETKPVHLHFAVVKVFLPPSRHQDEHPTLSHSPFLISPVYVLEKLHTSLKAEVVLMPREIWTTKKEVWVHKRGKTCLTNTTLDIDYLQVFKGIGSSEHTQNRLKPILTFDCSL